MGFKPRIERWFKATERSELEPQPTQRSQAIYGTDELLGELETLEAKGQQWIPLVAGVPQEESISLVEREAYSYSRKILNLSAYYGKTWDLTLQNRINIIYTELDHGYSALRKGIIDQGKAHLETALDSVRSLIVFLKSEETK